MEPSILDTIKKMLMVDPSYDAFDTIIIVNINSVMLSLNEIGVGPSDVYFITGSDETWEDFVGTATNLEAVKTYIYLNVRLLFDPPSTQPLIDAMKNQASMIEWRLKTQAEGVLYNVTTTP